MNHDALTNRNNKQYYFRMQIKGCITSIGVVNSSNLLFNKNTSQFFICYNSIFL